MKLYSSPISPYASRVRIQIAHQQLPVEIVPPPGGMSSDEVKAANPIGKIPVLEVGEARIAESWAIMEFLAVRHQQPAAVAMLPEDDIALAQLRALVRFTDLQLAPAMFPMFLALRGKADDSAVKAALENLQVQLKILDALLIQKPDASLDLADAALLPIIWYAQLLSRHFGLADCLAGVPQVSLWWQRCSQVSAAKYVLSEMESALKAALPTLFPE